MKKKILLLSFLGLHLSLAQANKPQVIFYQNEKNSLLDHYYQEDREVIIANISDYTNPYSEYHIGLDFDLVINPEIKKCYQFVDQNGDLIPQEQTIAGEGSYLFQFDEKKYWCYNTQGQDGKMRMPILTKKEIDKIYKIKLYDLKLYFGKEESNLASLNPHDKETNIDAKVKLKPQVYDKMVKDIPRQAKRLKEVKDSIALLEKIMPQIPWANKIESYLKHSVPAMYIHKVNVPLTSNEVFNMTFNWRVKNSLTGIGMWYFRNKPQHDYKQTNTTKVYGIIGWSDGNNTPSGQSKPIYGWRTVPAYNNEIINLRNEPIFPGDRRAYTFNKNVEVRSDDNGWFYMNDIRSHWQFLYDYIKDSITMQMEKNELNFNHSKFEIFNEETGMKEYYDEKNFYNYQQELDHYEKGYKKLLEKIDEVHGLGFTSGAIAPKMTELCGKFNDLLDYFQDGLGIESCAMFNTYFLAELLEKIDEAHKYNMTQSRGAKLKRLYEEMKTLNISYTVSLEDFQDPERTLTNFKAEIKNSNEIEILSTSKLGVKESANTSNNGQILVTADNHNVNILQFLELPQINGVRDTSNLKIHLTNLDPKDPQQQLIINEKNEFLPSVYGYAGFKGTLEKTFDNGTFSVPIKLQIGDIRFNDGVGHVCQNTGIYPLGELLNFYSPKSVDFSSNDFELVDENGEKKGKLAFINLDKTTPKEGRITAIYNGKTELNARLNVWENIPLKSNENPVLCGVAPIKMKKNAKNTGNFVYDLKDVFKGMPEVQAIFKDANGKEIPNGLLTTNAQGEQKIEISAQYGRCKTEKQLTVFLYPQPKVPTINDLSLQELCNGEKPLIIINDRTPNHYVNIYPQKTPYFDPAAVQNFGAQLSPTMFPAQIEYPQKVNENNPFSLFAYQYDPASTCLSQAVELKFNPSKFRELPFKLSQNQIFVGESAVVKFDKEKGDEIKKKDPNAKFQFSFWLGDKSVGSMNGTFFSYPFSQAGFYDVQLNLEYRKSETATCKLENKKIMEIEVREVAPDKIPDPILAQTQLKDGNIHVFIDKELVDVYVSLMPMDGQIGWENTFNGYFEFFKDWDYKVRKGIPYILTIYKGKKPDLNKIIFKLKILSLDGVYTETFKAQHNINPNSEF